MISRYLVVVVLIIPTAHLADPINLRKWNFFWTRTDGKIMKMLVALARLQLWLTRSTTRRLSMPLKLLKSIWTPRKSPDWASEKSVGLNSIHRSGTSPSTTVTNFMSNIYKTAFCSIRSVRWNKSLFCWLDEQVHCNKIRCAWVLQFWMIGARF